MCFGKENDFSKNKSNQDLINIVRPCTSGRITFGSQHCWASMLQPFPYPLAFCCMLLGVVARSLKLVKHLSPQLPTILCHSVSIAQQHPISGTTRRGSRPRSFLVFLLCPPSQLKPGFHIIAPVATVVVVVEKRVLTQKHFLSDASDTVFPYDRRCRSIS